jgi:hypothetical protein
MNPSGNAVLQVIRIGDNLHLALLLQCTQALYRRLQLHAIVGGLALGTVNLFLLVAKAQDARPAAGPGVADAGPVRN